MPFRPNTILKELAKLLGSTEFMDRFVRLISILDVKNSSLGLVVTLFILQINRLAKLGEKTGRFPKVSMGLKLIARERSRSFAKEKYSLPPFNRSANPNSCSIFYSSKRPGK